jgi:hypothetical protein
VHKVRGAANVIRCFYRYRDAGLHVHPGMMYPVLNGFRWVRVGCAWKRPSWG